MAITPEIIDVVPLVRLRVRDEAVTVPERGAYYQDGEHILLCLGPRERAGRTYYWFVDADEPLIIKSADQLAETPLQPVDLIPTGGTPCSTCRP